MALDKAVPERKKKEFFANFFREVLVLFCLIVIFIDIAINISLLPHNITSNIISPMNLSISLSLILSSALSSFLSVLPSTENKVTVIDEDDNSSMMTKRLWINITNKQYMSDTQNLVLEFKPDLLSSEINSKKLQCVENYNGGLYYYVDIPIHCNSVRVVAASESGKEIAKTKWNSNLYTARLYEVCDDVLRYRLADIFSPDAYVLGLFLSSYFSCSDSYENGYSAYNDIKQYWLSCYAGNVRGTKDSTYIYDYPLKCEDDSNKLRKTRLISLTDKIGELETLSSNSKTKERISSKRRKAIELLFFLSALMISIAISLLLVKPGRKKKNEI